MGNDRMDSRLAEGFRKIPEMWTAPSFCSATAGLLPGGTDTQRSGELLKHSRAAYYNKKACIPPLPPPPPPATDIFGEARAGTSKPGSSVRTEELTKTGGRHHLPGGGQLLSAPSPGRYPPAAGRQGRALLPAGPTGAPGGRGGARSPPSRGPRRADPHPRAALPAAGRAGCRGGLGEPIAPCAEGGRERGRTDRPTGGRAGGAAANRVRGDLIPVQHGRRSRLPFLILRRVDRLPG